MDRIILAAHDDTCVNLQETGDNASAVSIASVSALILKQTPAERDISLAFFDGEELPFFHTEGRVSIEYYHGHSKR